MKIEKQQNIMFIICAFVIMIAIYRSQKHDNYLKKDYAFTAGKTLKYEFNDGAKDCIQYKYFVDSVKYSGCVINDSEVSLPIAKFYKVKYSKAKPEISELYLTKEITDSIEIIKLGFVWRKR